MSETAGAASFSKLGFAKGQVIQEFGYDDDVDDDLRFEVEDVIGTELEDEEFNDGADGVIVWYRDGDEDLTDLLVDAISPLADDGAIWLLTPKRGRAGYVEPSDISEAASVAGLSETSIITISQDWSGNRLVGRRSGGRTK